MRPERAVVKKAIQDADGNLSRASALLGCTRQTLYTWIYQLGLERLAGVRMDKRTRLDTRGRMDTRTQRDEKEMKSGVYSASENGPRFHLVPETVEQDLPVQATFRCRESVWRRMKIEAIKRKAKLGDLAELAFERLLAEEAEQKKGRR